MKLFLINQVISMLHLFMLSIFLFIFSTIQSENHNPIMMLCWNTYIITGYRWHLKFMVSLNYILTLNAYHFNLSKIELFTVHPQERIFCRFATCYISVKLRSTKFSWAVEDIYVIQCRIVLVVWTRIILSSTR